MSKINISLGNISIFCSFAKQRVKCAAAARMWSKSRAIKQNSRSVEARKELETKRIRVIREKFLSKHNLLLYMRYNFVGVQLSLSLSVSSSQRNASLSLKEGNLTYPPVFVFFAPRVHRLWTTKIWKIGTILVIVVFDHKRQLSSKIRSRLNICRVWARENIRTPVGTLFHYVIILFLIIILLYIILSSHRRGRIKREENIHSNFV